MLRLEIAVSAADEQSEIQRLQKRVEELEKELENERNTYRSMMRLRYGL